MYKDTIRIHLNPEEGGGRSYWPKPILWRLGIDKTTELEVSFPKDGGIRLHVPEGDGGG